MQSFLLQVDETEIVAHEADEPDALVDFFDAFEYRSLYREPNWMKPPRGPDVSPQMRWYPVVTFLQLAADKWMATSAPVGYGHVYAPAHYVDAWIEVTDVRDRSPDEIARLKQHLSRP